MPMPLLYDLCQTIEEREHRRGRKPTPYSAAVFAAVMKVYSTKSTRRAVADLDLAYELGYLRKPVSFTTVWSYLEKPELLPILRKLIIASSKPLGAVETIFAVDSTNFPASRYVQWSEVKNRGQLEHDWSKLHLMCGVKTNIVTDAVILDRYAADVHQLPMLLNTTAQNFAVSALSADMIYNTVENQEAIAAVGATGYIPFKRRLTGASGGLWERAFHYYTYRQNEFRQHYHLRSNVESTMRMIKTKFGSYVRSKTEVAMANEVYCKVLCHNICCLIHSLYELEIAAELLDFKKNAAD